MKKVAVSNFKSGTDKTTPAVNPLHALVFGDQSVLAVHYDLK